MNKRSDLAGTRAAAPTAGSMTALFARGGGHTIRDGMAKLGDTAGRAAAPLRRLRLPWRSRPRPSGTPRPLGEVSNLVNAEHGFPALERALLNARNCAWFAFRVFDPDTLLRSEEAKAEGLETWMDLVRHALSRGVSVRFLLSDFDPIGAPHLHRAAWKAGFGFAALAREFPEGAIEVMPALHEARVGRMLRFAFWPMALMNLRKFTQEANGWETVERAEFFREAPGLWRYLRMQDDGRFAWRTPRLPRLYPVTHHQKIAVFDHEKAIIGGLDVDERRYDTAQRDRPGCETWHDVSVEVTGPVARDISAHIAECWNRDRLRTGAEARELTRYAPSEETPILSKAKPLDAPETSERREDAPPRIRLVRTVSVNRRRMPFYMSPKRLETSIERAYLELIARARMLLYFETQFFRHRVFAQALQEAAENNPDLQLLMVLPAAPEDIAFEKSSRFDALKGERLQTRCLTRVRRSFGARAFFVSPLRPVASDSKGRDAALGAEIVYVHSKVAIADDEVAIVSSANMNGRSMRWDTEAGVVIEDAECAAKLRQDLFRTWLPEDAPEKAFDMGTAVGAWRDLAHANARLPAERRRGFVAPHDPTPARIAGRDAPVPDDMI